MLNKELIGKTYTIPAVRIERGRMVLFSRATGQTDPVYFDDVSAKKSGYPGLLAPPTFLTTMEHRILPFFIKDLSVDVSRILHGGQKYEYFLPIFEGDILYVMAKVVDVYKKKSGKLLFFILEQRYKNQKKNLVAIVTITMIIKSGS